MGMWEDKALNWVRTFEIAAGQSGTGGVRNSQIPGFVITVIKIDDGFVYKVNMQIATREQLIDLCAGKGFNP